MTVFRVRSIDHNKHVQTSLDILFNIEKRKYTTAVLRFMARNGLNKNYNIRLFKHLVALPDLHNYLERYDIKNHKDLHKYVQQRLIEYVNNKLVTGKA